MKRARFLTARVKYVYGTVLLVVFSSLVAGLLLQRVVGDSLVANRNEEFELLVERIARCAEGIAAEAEPGAGGLLQQTLDSVIESSGVEVAALFGPGGILKGRAARPGLEAGLDAALREYGRRNREDPLAGILSAKGLVLLLVPLLSPDRPDRPAGATGTVLLAHEGALLEARLADFRERIWRGTAMMATIAAVLAFIATQHFTQPILRLARATAGLGAGEKVELVAVPQETEVGQLARHFNHLVQEVERSRGRLSLRQKNLQSIVDRKTRRLRDALDRMRWNAEQRDKFLSSLSHEVRTPLSNLQAAGEILDQFGADEPAVAAEFVPIIRGEALRLDELVSNFTLLTELEYAFELPPSPAPLLPTLRQAVEKLAAQYPAVQLCVAEHAHDRVCRHAPELIERVAQELIRNALFASPRGAIVGVEIDVSEDALTLRVHDQGSGLSEDDRDHIFEKFYQCGSVLTDKPPGSGLGLSICRQILRIHEGDIRVEHSSPRGTVVRADFPAFAPRRPPTPEAVPCSA